MSCLKMSTLNLLTATIQKPKQRTLSHPPKHISLTSTSIISTSLDSILLTQQLLNPIHIIKRSPRPHNGQSPKQPNLSLYTPLPINIVQFTLCPFLLSFSQLDGGSQNGLGASHSQLFVRFHGFIELCIVQTTTIAIFIRQ